jgi:hypothetical protein
MTASERGEDSMSEFVFLYRGGERPAGSPEQMQQQMQRWMSWMKGLSDQGFLKDPGNPLEPGGKLVSGKDKVVTDGPFAEAKDLVGGYTIVQANDLGHAAQLTSGCPILDIGGFVEVRPIMKMSL